LFCAICGKFYYQSGTVLKCQGALAKSSHKCWNHTQVRIEEVRGRVLPVLLEALAANPGFRSALSHFAFSTYESSLAGGDTELKYIASELKKCERSKKNYLKLLSEIEDLSTVSEELPRLEVKMKGLAARKAEIESQQSGTKRYATAAEIDADLPNVLASMMRESREFAAFLRKIIQARIVPVQALDSTQVRPRLVFKISFREFVKDSMEAEEKEHTIDLFNTPEQVKHMQACLEAKRAHPEWSLKKIAAELEHLDITYMTVKRAFDYARRMEREGLTEPYRVLTERPAKASRWRPRKSKPDIKPNDTDGEARPAA
jgi:hypothetical protein